MSDANSNDRSANSSVRRTSHLAIAIAWLVVALPAAWGVTQTAKTSVKLFQAAPAAPLKANPAIHP